MSAQELLRVHLSSHLELFERCDDFEGLFGTIEAILRHEMILLISIEGVPAGTIRIINAMQMLCELLRQSYTLRPHPIHPEIRNALLDSLRKSLLAMEAPDARPN